MNPTLNQETLEALRRLDACTLANAIETFHQRLRNEGFIDNTIHCLVPRLQPMLGYAVTVKIRGSAPPTTDGPYADRVDWWDYILSLPAPRVVVIEDTSTKPGLGSYIGSVHMHILQALGCVGIVTNGSVRDLPAAETAGFHYFAHSLAVSHTYIHIIEFGRQVQIGGLKIQSGDLLHGDVHGVQSVPLDLAPLIPPVADKVIERERGLIELCHSPQFSLEKLRAAVGGEQL